MEKPVVRLRKKRDIPIRGGHPWIFSNALEEPGTLAPGSLVTVVSDTGEYVATGMFNPHSTIRVRILSRDADETIDEDFFVRRFRALDAHKRKFLEPETTAFRVVHADADSLPGLIVDRYGDVLVFQIHAGGMDTLRSLVVSSLIRAFSPSAIVERSDVDVRKQEGLSDAPTGLRHGEVGGLVRFTECGLQFACDVIKGQKTGFFLDQRPMRARVRALSVNRRVLNLFAYTGAFSVYAAKGGASSVETVEASRQWLDLAKENFRLNGLDPDLPAHTFVKGDVFDYLNSPELTARAFDLIVCDPPAFAKSHHKKNEAFQAYGQLNTRCFELLSEGGILVTSSCSGSVESEEFRDLLRLASGYAGKKARLIDYAGQPQDHTENIAFPEGRYLKTFILEVV